MFATHWLAPARTLPLVALLVLALAPGAARAGRGTAARSARSAEPSTSTASARPSHSERKAANDARINDLLRQEAAAEAKAERQVSRWSERKLARKGWRSEQREKAVDARAKQLFGRTKRRQLKAAKAVDRSLAREADTKKEKKQKQLQEEQDEILRAGDMNRRLGTERQTPRVVKRLLQTKLPGLARRIPFLRRDTQLSPGSVADNIGDTHDATRTDHLDPVRSTMWSQRKRSRLTTESLYAGPWKKRSERPELPKRKSVLQLEGFRSLDADGIHPSVFVTDPDTGAEWKVKFLGAGERQVLSPEAVSARLLYGMGYHTQQVFRLRDARLSAESLLAAFEHKNRIGIRVPEGNPLGIRPGKYGRSPFDMGDQIKSVKMTDGRVLQGQEGARVLRQARRDPSLLREIRHVTVHAVDVVSKGPSKTESIGPFNPDAAQHVNRREMRGLSLITATWLRSNDLRFNNVRMDVKSKKGGKQELIHRISDSGGGLQVGSPNDLSWTIDVDLGADRLHSDHNRITLDAFDRTTLDDARWAVRKIGALSEAQIMASVASGADSYAVAVFYTEKLISRRDSLVRGFGLEAELGLLRPNGADTSLNVRGSGSIKLRDKKGKSRRAELPAGSHEVVNGRLVERGQATP